MSEMVAGREPTRCAICGQFVGNITSPAYVEEYRAPGLHLDPPELVPAHWECLMSSAGALPTPQGDSE